MAVVEAWTGGGKQLVELSDALGSAADAVCRELAAAGSCWGDDGIGMAFANGNGGSNPGFFRGRDAALAEHAQTVNLIRGAGGLMIFSGQGYAATEQANTIGAAPPGRVGAGVLSSLGVYRLPAAASHLARSDPPPGGLVGWVIGKFEELVAGCTWPNGNTGGLAAVQRACAAAAAACHAAARQVDAVSARVPAAGNRGSAAEKFTAAMAGLSGIRSGGGISGLARQWQALADSAGTLIKEKQAARWQIIVSAGVLVASLGAALAFGPITFGGSVAAWAAAAELEGQLLRAMLLQIAERVAAEAIMGAAFNTAMDLGKQSVNWAYGLQGFNWAEFAQAVAVGVIAGGVMGGLQFGAEPALEAVAESGPLKSLLEAGGVQARAANAILGGLKFGVSSAAGTVGNVAAQVPFGPVNLDQAAGFGVGMAALGVAQEATVEGVKQGAEALKEPTLRFVGTANAKITDLGNAVTQALRPGRDPAAPGAGPGTGEDPPPAIPSSSRRPARPAAARPAAGRLAASPAPAAASPPPAAASPPLAAASPAAPTAPSAETILAPR